LLQPTRLRKHRETVTKELGEIQSLGKSRVFRQAKRASEYYNHALEENWSMELTDFGFDFTLDDMIEQLADHKATVEHDAYPEVTKKVYREDFRAQYIKEFFED
jgi:hypothetical protein